MLALFSENMNSICSLTVWEWRLLINSVPQKKSPQYLGHVHPVGGGGL